MGRLKWPVKDFYTSSPYEFYYACKGYFDERDELANLFRNVAMFTSGNGVHKEFKRAWPENGGNDVETIVMDDAMKKEIMKIHNIKL